MPRAHVAAAAAVLVAALSLLVHRALAFDPEAWVVWSRELWSLSIDTSAGPSWKPLPVFVTAVLGASATAWLVLARAGALMAVAGAWRLGGWVAAALIVASPWWWLHGALGNAEPLLVALAAWAVVADRDGHIRVAFALGCAAALLRPEVWPFLAIYAWVRRAGLPLKITITAGAAIVALWVVPDALSSGLHSTRGARVNQRTDLPFTRHELEDRPLIHGDEFSADGRS
jgi:hypothetical protein